MYTHHCGLNEGSASSVGEITTWAVSTAMMVVFHESQGPSNDARLDAIWPLASLHEMYHIPAVVSRVGSILACSASMQMQECAALLALFPQRSRK